MMPRILATRQIPSTSSPNDGSRTITVTDAQPLEEGRPAAADDHEPPDVGALRLRGGPRPPRRHHRQHVEWEESVVDNEGCGRKSSKICCIYHRPRPFDESSDEGSSSSSSDSDSDSLCDHAHHHEHHSHSHDDDRNAYEVIPSSGKGKKKANPRAV